MPESRRFLGAMLFSLAALTGCSILSLGTGAMKIPPRAVLDALVHSDAAGMGAVVVRNVRLPRLAAGCVVGAALALAGLCFQSLLRNPLASEYTLGVSSGASLGAVAAALMHATWPLATPLAAFAGSLGAIVIVLYISHARLSFETGATILAGVIFTALANAALSLMLSIASPNELHTFFFWFMGSLAEAEWRTLVPVGVGSVVLAIAIYLFAWRMNALSVGEDFAAQVGVPVQWTKGALFLMASLLTGLAVSIAGTIGFVGLVVPHLARLAVGVDNRKLIPVALTGGAALCVAADVLSRTLLAPDELPVGVVTAFVGVPMFVALMRKRA